MRKNALGKVFRSRAEWQSIFARFRASGLSQGDFCKQEGLAITSFHKWQQKLSRETAFVEVAAPAKPSSWDLELDLGDGRVLKLRG